MDLSGDLPVLFSVFPDVSPFPQATVCTGNPGCFCTFPGKLKKRDIRLPVSGRSPGCLYLKCIPIHHQAGRIYDFVFSFTKFPEDMASSSSLYPLSGTGTYGNHHRAFCSFPKPAALFPALHSHRILYFIWRSMRSSQTKSMLADTDLSLIPYLKGKLCCLTITLALTFFLVEVVKVIV